MNPTPGNTQSHSGTDPRKLALANWITLIDKGISSAPTLTPISSDAGFRRYFRYQSSSPILAVDAPPATEDTHQFVALARFLRDWGILAPRIIAADEKQGFLLVEDFGDQLLYNALTPENAESLYGRAMNDLIKFHQCPDQPDLIPRYDRVLLRRELDIFKEWFVQTMLGHSLTANEQAMLDQTFTLLENNSLAQPQVFVHRDFHSRNLILCPDNQLGVIDFQGALWGAITYDLVSLLRDCYKRWPAQQVRAWALTYHKKAIAQQLIPDVDEEIFLRWFDWMGLQRHIKVLGIFARLLLRDNKPGYLKDLPLVIRYTLEVTESYPELAPFADWFKHTLLPLIKTQSWYQDYRTAGDNE